MCPWETLLSLLVYRVPCGPHRAKDVYHSQCCCVYCWSSPFDWRCWVPNVGELKLNCYRGSLLHNIVIKVEINEVDHSRNHSIIQVFNNNTIVLRLTCFWATDENLWIEMSCIID